MRTPFHQRFLLRLLLAACLFFGIQRFCHHMTEGFSLSKITTSHPLTTENPNSLSQEEQAEIAQLLDQPFYFYKKGGQCFAFIGEDGETIIKFFKQHHIRFWNWLSTARFPFSLDYLRIKLLKKHRHQTAPYLFQSAKFAYENLKEETGLVYLQLNNGVSIEKKLTIYDKLHIAHTIDLNQFQFAVQQKAAPVFRKFRILIKQNNLEPCKRYIDSMIDLILTRSQQGIADRDFNLWTNFGLLETRMIEIDIGSFHAEESLKDPQVTKAELIFQTAEFKRWLKKKSPELASYFAEKVNAL